MDRPSADTDTVVKVHKDFEQSPGKPTHCTSKFCIQQCRTFSTAVKLHTFKVEKLQALPCHKKCAVKMLAMIVAFKQSFLVMT
jgi:hypothetical protein